MRPVTWLLAVAVCCLPVVSALGPAHAEEPKKDAPTAEEVLHRMAKVYAHFKSYRDSGIVKTVFVGGEGNWTDEKPFTTAFVRPDRFRFEYKEKMPDKQEYRYIIWAKGKNVQTWWDVKPGVEKVDSLALALAEAHGVSDGSARTIPGLLLADQIGAGWVMNLEGLKRIEDARLGESDFFRVQGETGIRGHGPVTLWIDKSTFLVRRIDEQVKFEDFRIETMTIYDPEINSEIPDKKLQFDPPKQK